MRLLSKTRKLTILQPIDATLDELPEVVAPSTPPPEPAREPIPLLMWVWLQTPLDSTAFVHRYCPRPGVIACQISALDQAFFVSRARNLLVTDHPLTCPASEFRQVYPQALSCAVLLASDRASNSSCNCCPRLPRNLSVADFWAAITERAEPQGYASQRLADRITDEVPLLPETPGLSPRELVVLRCLAEGDTIAECAQKIKVSNTTVENHKYRIMKKLKIHRAQELVLLGSRLGWIHHSTFSQTDQAPPGTLAANLPPAAGR